MKRILAFSLVIAMVFAMTTTVFAANSGTSGGGGFYVPTTREQTVRQVLSDGTVIETTTHEDGSQTIVTTIVEEATNADGTKVIITTVTTVEKDKDGNTVSSKTSTTVDIIVSAKDAEDGKVLLPIAIPTGKQIPINVKTPAPVEITAPVDNANNGFVKTENDEIQKDCDVNENGVVFDVEGNAQVKVIDNTKTFNDVSGWAAEAIRFVTARELFLGTSEETFDPTATVTRAMVYTVLSRLAGAELDSTGADWYEAPLAWAVAQGITDGTNPTAPVTREQLATMLYRFVGQPAVEADLASFGDAESVNGWASAAMQWAVANGLINGIDGNLAPQGEASRAELAAIMMRFIKNI